MKKLILLGLVVALVVALVAAYPSSVSELHVGEPVFYQRVRKSGESYYAGVYTGVCHVDGVYYKSKDELVFCSNKEPSVQKCPYGSRNNDANKYIYGSYYGYDDFCNVNLINEGFVRGYTQ